MYDEAGLHTVAELDNMLELILYLVIEAGYGANAESDNDEVAGDDRLGTGVHVGGGYVVGSDTQYLVAEQGLYAGVLGIEEVKTVVGIGGDGVRHHVDNGDVVAGGEHSRGLETGLACAEDNDLLAGDLGLLSDIIAHADDVVGLYALYRGDELVGTGRNERGIRLHLAQHLGGALGIELDADVELLYHALIVVDEPAELVLANRGVSEVDGAAETVGLFKYGDIEAALGERNGGFQTGRACADYCDGQTVAVYVEGAGMQYSLRPRGFMVQPGWVGPKGVLVKQCMQETQYFSSSSRP